MSINKIAIFFVFVFLVSGCAIKNNDYSLFKEKYKTRKDILVVSQTNTTIFEKKQFITQFCSFSIFDLIFPQNNVETIYILKKPIKGIYYYVFNVDNRLVAEGKWIKINDDGGGSFEKNYHYETFGRLDSVIYYNNGGLWKVEVFDSDNQVKQMSYFNSKGREKDEYYKNGKLIKTIVYKQDGTNEYEVIEEK